MCFSFSSNKSLMILTHQIIPPSPLPPPKFGPSVEPYGNFVLKGYCLIDCVILSKRLFSTTPVIDLFTKTCRISNVLWILTLIARGVAIGHLKPITIRVCTHLKPIISQDYQLLFRCIFEIFYLQYIKNNLMKSFSVAWFMIEDNQQPILFQFQSKNTSGQKESS